VNDRPGASVLFAALAPEPSAVGHGRLFLERDRDDVPDR
jgi:hypothetical protein